jgi:hypothetical protein
MYNSRNVFTFACVALRKANSSTIRAARWQARNEQQDMIPPVETGTSEQ